MAEASYLWTTGGGLGDCGPYSRNDWAAHDRIISSCSRYGGIAPGYASELAGSVTGANTVSINTGGAVVDGKVYNNTAPVSVTIPSSVGVGNTRIDRIVLRANWAAQTVRITLISGTDAATPAAPAVTQISETTFDLPLYQALVDTAGAVTLTDERLFARDVMYRRGGSPSEWNTFGANVYTERNFVLQTGIAQIVIANASNGSAQFVTFPTPFAGAPICFTTIVGAPDVPSEAITSYMTPSDGTEAVIGVMRTQTVGAETVTVHWLAIGPRA